MGMVIHRIISIPYDSGNLNQIPCHLLNQTLQFLTMQYKTTNPEKTKSIAKKIAKEFKNKGGVIFLKGGLGAGKTTFVQGFAKELGIKEKIISPTFVLIRQHVFNTDRLLFHIDLYRLSQNSSKKEIGIDEMIQNKNIVLIEWPEKVVDLPKPDLIIEFTIDSPNTRIIHVI